MELLTIIEFLQRYEDALNFLHAQGVRIGGTRLARYRKVLSKAYERELRGLFDHQTEIGLPNALVEAADIIEIASISSDWLAGDEIRKKLQEISGGNEVMSPIGQDPSRDYAFEFTTAAVLQIQGRFSGFSKHGGDVTIDPNQYPVECKRLSSLHRAEARLREGKRKLERLRFAGQPPGLIAIDLTRPILIAQGSIEASDESKLRLEADQRLVAYLAKHVMTESIIEALQSPATLGIVARYSALGFVKERANIRRAVIWQACSLHADKSAEDLLFRELAQGFGYGKLENGTVDDIREAMKRVPL